VASSGLSVAQGLIITQPFYWDLNDASRAWSARFSERQAQAVTHCVPRRGVFVSAAYLNAAWPRGTNDAPAVIRALKEKRSMTICSDQSLFVRTGARFTICTF